MSIDRRMLLQWTGGAAAVIGSGLYLARLSRRRATEEAQKGLSAEDLASGTFVIEDLAIPEDQRFGSLALSPSSDHIALAAYDFTTARICAGVYPPQTPEDYHEVASVSNATRGIAAVTWCHENPEQIAFVVQQTRSHRFPRITTEAEFRKLSATAKLRDEDYELVLYSTDTNTSEMRRVCELENGPINGHSKEGSLVALAWPSLDRLYYYAAGEIVRVKPATGECSSFFRGEASRSIRNVFIDRSQRIATYEFESPTDSPTLVFLDDNAKRIATTPLAPINGSRTIPYPLYGGGSIYVDMSLEEDLAHTISVIQLNDLVTRATFPATHEEWSLSPVAVAEDDEQFVCHATKMQTSNVKPELGKTIAKPLPVRIPVSPAASSGEHFTHMFHKLVRVQIR